jgi:hypothetical protein
LIFSAGLASGRVFWSTAPANSMITLFWSKNNKSRMNRYLQTLDTFEWHEIIEDTFGVWVGNHRCNA